MKLFCVLIFFCLLYKGNCQCSMDEIKISQSRTGAQVEGKPEWRVTVTNNCVCSQYSISFDCTGFQTVEEVDAAILAIFTGNQCLFYSGKRIVKSNPISFTYAWDNSFPFQVISSTTYCS